MSDEGRAPLHDSLADAVIAASVNAALFGDDGSPPPRLGRFRVLRSLGAGAMGTVWLARDDELDRDVAVKLLRAHHGDDDELAARLLDEAKGLARLAHPNVVVVHEVGTAERGIFIAMEHVDGGTLAQWQTAAPRSVAEIVEMYAQAGRGLAAAHAAGVVHRDFKPDNVLVGSDGRPRVVDFGLAQIEAVGVTAPIGDGGDDGVLQRRTRIGDRVGTPAYMAPEQLAAGKVDARSDQFAFGLALFEAIAGRPAFTEVSIDARIAAIDAGVVTWPAHVPRSLRATIGRALARDPDARWPDMDTLVRALVVRPRRWWPVPLGIAVIGGALWLGRSWAADDRCRDAGATEQQTWSTARRHAVEEAFAASAMPFREAASVTTLGAIDLAVQRSVDAARSTCAAAELRDDAELVVASDMCLQVVRDEIETLVLELAEPSDARIAAAPLRAVGLPDASACSDPRRAKLVGRIEDASVAAAARDALARARLAYAELVFGAADRFGPRLDAALADAREAATQAEAASALVVAAIARTLEARLLVRRGDNTGAEVAASRAVEHAAAIDDPVLRTTAMLQRIYTIGASGNRIVEARAVIEQARASLIAAGDPPVLRGQLENNLGLVLARDGEADRDESIAHHRRAIELFAAALGDAHPDTMAARVNLGSALARLDRTDDALAELDPIVAPALAVWGEDHPSTARLFGVIGNAWLRKGELTQAETWLRRALASAERVAPGDAEVANAQYNLATALRRRMDEGGATSKAAALEAVRLLRAAIVIREGLEGHAPANLIAYRVSLGEAELGAGNSVAAEAELRLALATCERTGAAALDFARVRLALARAVADRDPGEARVLAKAAREAFATAGRTTSVASCDALLAGLRAP